MGTWLRHFLGVTAAAAAVFALAQGAGAETFSLELKRLESLTASPGGTPAGYPYQMSRPQYSYMLTGAVSSRMGMMRFGRLSSDPSAEFSKVVTKQPAKYHAEHPFRGVAKLGSGQYGFVVDCDKADSTDYSRLYFDLNHNGDLTDDKVLEGKQRPGQSSTRYSYYDFPRVDITLDADGTKVDYSFFFSVSSEAMTVAELRRFVPSTDAKKAEDPEKREEPKKKVVSVTAGLLAAAYREGKITLDGKSRHVVLLDYNSNGRFDDEAGIRKSSTGQVVSPVYGDMLLVDPDAKAVSSRSRYDWWGGHVAKLVDIDGGFYELKVTPAGDKVTLAPAPIGHVEFPSEGFRATLYNDKALLQINGEKSRSVPLPAGQWNLISYTVDLTGRWEAAGKGKDGPEQPSSLKTLAKSLTQGSSSTVRGSRTTRLLAYGSKDSKPIKVGRGETVRFPFGPPYKPVVNPASAVRGGQLAPLEMALLGSGGERCASLLVNGGRPPQPEFTIRAPDGEEIESGKFQWG